MNQGKEAATIINKDFPQYAHLVWIIGRGPKNIRTTSAGSGRGMTWERSKYDIIPGHHPKLVSELWKRKDDYNKAAQEWDRARYDALNDFKRKWDDEHPMPRFEVQSLIDKVLRRVRKRCTKRVSRRM